MNFAEFIEGSESRQNLKWQVHQGYSIVTIDIFPDVIAKSNLNSYIWANIQSVQFVAPDTSPEVVMEV